MPTCIMCDKKINTIQYIQSEKSCCRCLKEPRFMMEVEWDSQTELDYDIWSHNDLDWLMTKFITGKEKGFEVSIGSCPGITLLSVKDTYRGKEITEIVKSIINKKRSL